MQIPEILRGTPAVCFREWYGLQFVSDDSTVKSYLPANKLTGEAFIVHTFLSAPFDPAEMLQEENAFKGVTVIWAPDGRYCTIWLKEGEKQRLLGHWFDDGRYHFVTDPKTEHTTKAATRDDFINDFNRAKTGVTLIWKGGENGK